MAVYHGEIQEQWNALQCPDLGKEYEKLVKERYM